MGDSSFEVIDISEEDESRRLLSPINNTGSRRKRSSNHYRSVSYGSIVPSFIIDVHILRQLLPVKEEIKKPERTQSTTSDKDDVVENETVDVDSNKPPLKKKHSRVDSLIDNTGLPLVNSQGNFITALDSQLKSLFSFVSFHMSQIDQELLDFEEKQALLTEVVDPDVKIESIDSKSAEEMDNASVGGDSGIEEDHLGSAMGFLTRIKEVCLTMKRSIDTSMQQLDELVGIYDHRMPHEDGVARKLLNGHQSQQADLGNRIDECILEIDTKLQSYAKKNDNSNKILELRTLQRAKKERMKYLDVLGFVMLLISSSVVVLFSTYMPSSRWTILLRLLRSPLMIVGYMYFIGFNMMVWARSGINYISIFDFPRKSTPTPSFMFRIGNTFSILFTVMIVVCLITGTQALFVSDKVTGFLMWIAILIFWLNPFDMLHRLGRYSFLLVSVRVLIAPLVIVLFADFWFADQLNSLLALMLDIQYLFCYSFTWSSWDSNTVQLKSCTMVSNGIRPIISCLPALWRLLQCLRCYYNTRKVAHLFNAVKYFTTFPVVVFATFFAVEVKPSLGGNISWSFEHLNLQKTGWMIIAWMISALFHALYTFYWDVVMDWGLCRVCDGCYVFRSTLLYRKWTYILAIIFDFFIRFACVAKLTLAIVYHIDSDVIYSSLILLEILRRIVWNFFRIEYEQVMRSSTL